jgi:hypothetical protein
VAEHPHLDSANLIPPHRARVAVYSPRQAALIRARKRDHLVRLHPAHLRWRKRSLATHLGMETRDLTATGDASSPATAGWKTGVAAR